MMPLSVAGDQLRVLETAPTNSGRAASESSNDKQNSGKPPCRQARNNSLCAGHVPVPKTTDNTSRKKRQNGYTTLFGHVLASTTSKAVAWPRPIGQNLFHQKCAL